MHADEYYPGKKHPSVQSVTGVRDVPRVGVKAKLITGTYILQVNRASFNQNEINRTCLLCQQEDETTEHFILHCTALSAARQSVLKSMEDMYVDIFNHQPDLEDLLQFILDSGALLGGEEAIQSQLRIDIEKASRCLCHRLHIE